MANRPQRQRHHDVMANAGSQVYAPLASLLLHAKNNTATMEMVDAVLEAATKAGTFVLCCGYACANAGTQLRPVSEFAYPLASPRYCKECSTKGKYDGDAARQPTLTSVLGMLTSTTHADFERHFRVVNDTEAFLAIEKKQKSNGMGHSKFTAGSGHAGSIKATSNDWQCIGKLATVRY